MDSAFNAEAKADEQAARERAADRKALEAGFRPDEPAALPVPSVDPVPVSAAGRTLPPSDSKYRYIGRWAASVPQCETGAWQFRSRKLVTAGETACDFPNVGVSPAGYELRGSCQADGRQIEEALKLSFDETRRTMRVAGRALGPVELLYCGD